MKALRFTMVSFAATALIGVAQAQSSYSCVNDLPNPYKQVTGWAQMERPWAPTNNVFVDSKDNIWVMDRCEDKGCLGSREAPIWELSPDGKTLKNFGAGLFIFPHTVRPDAEGNVWAIDGDAKESKGNQVFKMSDRKSTRLNSSHEWISYAVFCLKKKKTRQMSAQSLPQL